jgi:hypothetical protein
MASRLITCRAFVKLDFVTDKLVVFCEGLCALQP